MTRNPIVYISSTGLGLNVMNRKWHIQKQPESFEALCGAGLATPHYLFNEQLAAGGNVCINCAKTLFKRDRQP